ncbi:TonB-dependent receptor [Methylomonas sp. UP202]|uniref:TonB-dependent siderophore receptor n=1 Tax=Methylomonas sp. UP202 TaxID=3040943 RepID=UPI00247A79FE|nr:TonB-dependent receptor [Methylomonas sp. UP202]WGS88388.1 TonB-dependent receptor [Methylomonas sp. UP202]
MSNMPLYIFVAPLLLASSAARAEDQTFAINIPAQPLARALDALSRQTGVQPFYADGAVAGKTAPAVNGRFSVAQALQQLLAGSGLVFSFTAANTVAIKPAGAAGERVETLGAVTVTAQTAYLADDPYNPSYHRTNASTATRTDTPLMETPASIQVVPQQVLKDQQAITLADGLRNVSGVQISPSPTYENFTVRGFDMNGATYRNGIREASWAAETANVERLEVLKGPGAMLYGRIEPGGMINRVLKKPLFTPYYALQQQFGSFDNYRTTLDATGALNQDKTFAYRFNLAYQDTKSFRDLFYRDRIFIAPQFTWKVSDRTEVNFGMEYQRDDFRWDDGLPVLNGATRPANLPINTALSDQSAHANQERNVADLNWSHAFNDDWKISQQFSAFLGSRIQYDIFPYGIHANQRTVDRYNWDNNVKSSQTYSFNTNLLGHLNTWGVKHTLLVGHDYYAYTDESQNRCCASVDSIDIYNPQPFTGNLALLPLNYGHYHQEWNGVYFQDQMVFWDRLHLLGGGRYDWADYGVGSSGSSYAAAEAAMNANHVSAGKFSPRVGVLYRAFPWLSLYGNYTESLGTNNSYSARNTDGTPLKPQEARQFEGGIKTELFDQKLTASLAYFDIVKTNLATGNPDPTLALLGYTTTVGAARSRGVEFDLAGELSENWSLIANYTYLDTRITKFTEQDVYGGVSLLGKRFPNAPRHSANVWLKYEFTDPAFAGLSLGSGIRVTSQRQGDPQNSYQLPGYATWDASAAYKFKVGPTRMTAQLNAYNLLDKRYFTGADTFDASQRYYGNMPGAPISFIGSIKVEY